MRGSKNQHTIGFFSVFLGRLRHKNVLVNFYKLLRRLNLISNIFKNAPTPPPSELFCVFQVTCVGQVIGAIVAETQAQAQRAANLVKVTYEDLLRILTIEVNN